MEASIRRMALAELDPDGLRRLIGEGEPLFVERKEATPKEGLGPTAARSHAAHFQHMARARRPSTVRRDAQRRPFVPGQPRPPYAPAPLPEAQIVRWIFERVARGGWPIRKVARKLEERQALDD